MKVAAMASESTMPVANSATVLGGETHIIGDAIFRIGRAMADIGEAHQPPLADPEREQLLRQPGAPMRLNSMRASRPRIARMIAAAASPAKTKTA